MKKHLPGILAPILLFCLFSTACASVKVTSSQLERNSDPGVGGEDLSALVSGNTGFAFDLYQAIGSAGNQVFSPYSISLALAMAYGGAAGETANQMANVLQYTLPPGKLHPAFNALDLDISHRPEQAAGVDEENRFELTIANSIWGQRNWTFLPGFLDLLASNYGTGMRLVNFENAPEDARRQINAWISEQTKKRIQDIIPTGAIDPRTRLVLVNAIYFKATWEYEFSPNSTTQKPFHLLDGETVNVPMMAEESLRLNYASDNGWQAVVLPYKGGLTDMLIIVPNAGEFKSFASELVAEVYNGIVMELQPQMVDLSLPKFKFETSLTLKNFLIDMGMSDAFDENLADFSGMDAHHRLFISDALHKAFIAVDERGTEAAAATVVMMAPASLPPEAIKLTIDRPFFFAIRDVPTGTILFMGRVVDPR